MKRIITAYRNGREISGITESLNSLSVETVCCDMGGIEEVLQDYEAEAVLSAGFNRHAAEICYEKGLPYISWVLESPAPEVLVPEILYPGNRIYIADHNLYRILAGSGVGNVYHMTAGIPEKQDLLMIGNERENRFDAADIRERIFFAIDEDERKYLLGIEKAQELYHVKNLFFSGMGAELVDKIYAGLKLDPGKDPVFRRYYVCECLLRQIVKKREKSRADGFGSFLGKRIVCFDDTGMESLGAMLAGYTVFSDGCGLSSLGLSADKDYFFYDDAADLAYKLKKELPESTGRKKITDFSLKNVIRKMIFC